MGHCGRCGAHYDLTALEIPNAWEGASRIPTELSAPPKMTAPMDARRDLVGNRTQLQVPLPPTALARYDHRLLARPHGLRVEMRAASSQEVFYREGAQASHGPLVTIAWQQQSLTKAAAAGVVLVAVAMVVPLLFALHFDPVAIIAGFAIIAAVAAFAYQATREHLIRLTLTDGRVLVEDSMTDRGPVQEVVSASEVAEVLYLEQQVDAGSKATDDNMVIPVHATMAELSLKLHGGRTLTILGRDRDWRTRLWIARVLEKHLAGGLEPPDLA